jgi:hypothetical protein
MGDPPVQNPNAAMAVIITHSKPQSRCAKSTPTEITHQLKAAIAAEPQGPGSQICRRRA